ncbi:accessory gland-specific peptide 57Da [Drosophila sechellia]|uniref:GM10211 n=1 Tax=Drosophila sechellia TaxID=7238 RepID=B4ICE5_DROSE|nr:accessory gland-specific peptide 57Da [Drosophila sechellia]EDW45041.1 GM10211 [Drosophila sechellia]
MKFLALFVTLLVVLALVSGQKSQNTNHNVIVIGKKPGAAPAAAPAAPPAAAPAAPEAGVADAPAET